MSRDWVLKSLGIFLVTEMILVNGAAGFIAGCFGHVFRYKLEVVVILSGYYFGGFVVGLVSREVRVNEATVGALISYLLVFLISFYSPFSFFGANTMKLVVGGAIAGFLAAAGAKSGERTAAKFGNRASRDYIGGA